MTGADPREEPTVDDRLSLWTRAVAGEAPDAAHGAIGTPIAQATSYVVKPGLVGFSAADMTEAQPYFYSRWASPTVRVLEERLADLDDGEDAVCFASGMAAVSGLLFHLLRAGDHAVVSEICYAGVAELAANGLRRAGVEVTFADLSDLAEVRAAVRPGTRLVWAETPVNPTLRLADVEALAGIAHAAGALLAVDSTIATPFGLRPLELGADFAVHSLTKYAGGHGDALGGAVIGRRAAAAALRQDALVHHGGVLSPNAASLILRGLATLPLRMRAHEEGARKVAAWLEGHPRVRRVLYPGLGSHPQAALARRQLRNCSGLLSFVADGGEALSRQIADRLRLVLYAVSLGKHRSLVYYLPTEDLLRTSFPLRGEKAERFRALAGDGLFRLSVGLEDPGEIIADLERALA
jgi:cystathionine gamma-synthase/methionine-gamma-lyase